MATQKKQGNEANRLTWFLMGTVLTLAIIFTALEYTSSSGDEDIGESLLEDFGADMEPYPIVEKTPILTMAPKEEEKVSIDKLKITEATSQDSIAEKEREAGLGEEDKDAIGKDEEGLDEPQDELADDKAAQSQPIDFRIVQQIPEFPGGMGAFVQWLTKNIRYPQSAQRRKQEGKVVITFIVNEDGSTSDIRVAQSADVMLNTEALRVMQMMPKWKPGVENDKPCRTMMAIPIIFKL